MLVRTLDLPGLESLLKTAAPPGGRLLVHHFATWCEPCEDELPLLGKLLESSRGLPFRSVGIAWDRFLVNAAPETIVEACRSFLARLGCSFDELVVYLGAPEELFASQRIESGTVPFTEVRDAHGARVVGFVDPIETDADAERLKAALLGTEAAR